MAHHVESRPVHERDRASQPVPLGLVGCGEVQLAAQPALHGGARIDGEELAAERRRLRVAPLGDAHRVGLPLASQEPARDVRGDVRRVPPGRVSGARREHRVPVERVHRRPDRGIEIAHECSIPEIISIRELGPHFLEEPDRLPGVRVVLFFQGLIELGRVKRVDADRIRVEGARESEPPAIIRLGDGEFAGKVARWRGTQVDAPDEHGPRDLARDHLEPVAPRAHEAGGLGCPRRGGGEENQDEEKQREPTASGCDRTGPPSN